MNEKHYFEEQTCQIKAMMYLKKKKNPTVHNDSSLLYNECP